MAQRGFSGNTLSASPLKILQPRIAFVVALYLGFFALFALAHAVFLIAFVKQAASVTAYLVALRYDAATLAMLLGLPTLVYIFSARVEWLTKATLWIIAFLSHYTFVVLAVDLLYYGYAAKHATVELQIYFRNYIEINRMGLREYPWVAVGYAVSLVVFFLFWKRVIRRRRAVERIHFSGRRALRIAVAVVLFILLHVIAFRGGLQGRPIRPADAYQYLPQAEADFALNGLYTTFYALFHPTSFPARGDAATITAARKLFAAPGIEFLRDEYPFLRKKKYAQPAILKNIVFIILESWSAKRVGTFGDKMGATPFFDSLAAKGLLFTNAFATGRRSIASLPSAISSIPTLYGSLYITSPFEQNAQRGMGAIFREQSYATQFTYASKPGSMGFNAYARLAGFENVVTRADFASDAPVDGTWGVYDHVMLARVLADFDAARKPVLSVAYTLHPHPPFNLPAGFDFFKEDIPRAKYYNALRYCDDALRRFFTEAEKRAWFGDTVFVLMADHAYEEKPGFDSFHIPLLFYAPGFIKPMRDARIASELDVLPTLLDLLKISAAHAAMGRSLLAEEIPLAYLDLEHAAAIVTEKYGERLALIFPHEGYRGYYGLVQDPQMRDLQLRAPFDDAHMASYRAYIDAMGYAVSANKISREFR